MPFPMRYPILLLVVLSTSLLASAQKVFFKSAQTFSKDNTKTFYSSIALQNNLLLFNANDYKLYAYDKNTGQLKWQHKLDWKSDIAPFFVQNTIWANGNDEVLQLDTATGKPLKAIAISRMDTKPTIINNVLYGTGIYNAGCLFAYDLQQDSVLWSRFIAHGIAQTPHYLPGHIIANAEGNNWLEVAYNGKLLNAACEEEEAHFPSELSCAKKYLLRTHDGKEIKGKLALKIDKNDYGVEQTFHAPHATFIINKNMLFVIGNKLKLKLEKDLEQLAPGIDPAYGSTVQILQAAKETVWLHLGDHLLEYNYIKKKKVRAINLSTWAPHQVLLDENKIWLISSTDGLLYGVTID